jgi:hypothetical protein
VVETGWAPDFVSFTASVITATGLGGKNAAMDGPVFFAPFFPALLFCFPRFVDMRLGMLTLLYCFLARR